MPLPKQTIPHPDEAKSDADHLKIFKHALAQGEHGHYGFKDVTVSQETLENGDVVLSGKATRYETNPGQPAADHDLVLGQ